MNTIKAIGGDTVRSNGRNVPVVLCDDMGGRKSRLHVTIQSRDGKYDCFTADDLRELADRLEYCEERWHVG